ncbi:MAG: glycosyltransferase family 2 protein [Candidatus Omnitrophica bacterium]|nr:glycosyltransferase family 2 protein [Candidatus Omnitrophota bacterium]
MNPKLSIVILNWNGKKYLKDCLCSVFEQDYEDFNVVFVDNHSTDDSTAFVRENFPKVEVLQLDENYGFSKGTNIGIKYVLKKNNPGFILLLNNDTHIIQKDTFTRLVNFLEKDKKTGILGCKLVFPDGRVQCAGERINPLLAGGIALIERPMGEGPYKVDAIWGAVFLIKRAVIDKIGLFDEDFSPYLCEDADYCLRAKKAGYLTKIAPSIEVIHYLGPSISKIPSGYVDSVRKKNTVRFLVLNSYLPVSIFRLLYEANLYLKYFLVSLFERKNKEVAASPWNLKIRHDWKAMSRTFLQNYPLNTKFLKNIILKRIYRPKKIWYQ